MSTLRQSYQRAFWFCVKVWFVLNFLAIFTGSIETGTGEIQGQIAGVVDSGIMSKSCDFAVTLGESKQVVEFTMRDRARCAVLKGWIREQVNLKYSERLTRLPWTGTNKIVVDLPTRAGITYCPR